MGASKTLAVLIAPGFNMAATMSFIDPFRAVNYLAGEPLYLWRLVHTEAEPPRASNGARLDAARYDDAADAPDYGVVSTSWRPELTYDRIRPIIRRWRRHGSELIGVDTGGFVLAAAGVLAGRRATVHYEHIDAFAETYGDVEVTEELFTIDGPCATTCGGGAATDLALHLIGRDLSAADANAAARYLFHER
ncbi:MAG: AraC family transcriptional regulator, partial [Pseudomonadota bacterium]